MQHDQKSNEHREGSISLGGGVAMGTGVMVAAGIFALIGLFAQLAGPLLPLAFIVGAIVTSFSAYSYIKMSNVWPSAGGHRYDPSEMLWIGRDRGGRGAADGAEHGDRLGAGGVLRSGRDRLSGSAVRFRRNEIGAAAPVLLMAFFFDVVVLIAFTAMKLESDSAMVLYAAIGIAAVFVIERVYLSRWLAPQAAQEH